MSWRKTSRKVDARGRRKAHSYELFARIYIKQVTRQFYGRPLLLEKWQRDNIWEPIFGTLDAKGNRYYKRALIGLPRIYGKSVIAAAIVLTCMVMEPTHKGEYGIVATSEQQAHTVFDIVAAMIRLSPELSNMFEIRRKVIVDKLNGSEFGVYPAEYAALQGKHFTVCIIDEMHVHRNSSIYEACNTGMKGIPGALLVIITTAGEQSGPLWDYILPIFKRDRRSYIYWLGADKNDDPTALSTWKKVAIASWHSVADIRDQFNSTTLHDFIMLTLNVFPPPDIAADMAFARPACAACLDPAPYDFDAPMVVGIDGAISNDSFAIVLSSAGEGGTVHLYPVIWSKGDDAEHFYDIDAIEKYVADLWDGHDVERVAMDPARLVLFDQHLRSHYGVPTERFDQGGTTGSAGMCAACMHLSALLESGRLHIHGPQAELLVEHMGNAVKLTREPLGWRIGKFDADHKIDAAVAAAIAALITDQSDEASGAMYEV